MAHDALRTILPVAGWPEERARTVEITGGADPVLPTPFRIGAAGAAALAATGLAAADLWELRTGRRQEVAVDLRQAVASLRSGHYLEVNGAKVRNERNPVMGMYPAKNGRWSYIHANFPNHLAAALRVLGCEENRQAVRQAVARWDALELEALRGLVREADVFSQGYRPGTLGNRGLSPEELAQLRPGLVYVSLCAFSHKGPWASRRGFDTVVQNVSGITTRQGELFPGAEPGPQFYPVSALDHLTGSLMAFGAMVALARRASEGGS